MADLREWGKTEQAAGRTVSKAWEGFFRTAGAAGIEHSEEINETSRIAEVQDKHYGELLRLAGVVGVAASLKVTKGLPTKNWSLTVFVEKKLDKVSKGETIPAEIAGVRTDVVEVGRPEALTFNAKVRPALPGYSIGHHSITAGTFGCVVRDIRRCCCKVEKEFGSDSKQDCPGDYLILSNNHVLAAENDGKPGDLILQPGAFDGGVFPSDAVATLERFEPIVFSAWPTPPGYNLVDAALARPIHSRDFTASIIGALMPRGVDQAFVGGQVIKAGRTTQITSGFVIAVNATIVVNYGNKGFALFHHQILSTPMSAGGDSGSLLMDRNLSAVGLLFAGSPFITIFNHIGDVETVLGVRPLTAPRFG